MITKDIFSTMRGQVYGEWRNAQGVHPGPKLRFNKLSYSCADILAGLVSGRPEYRPTSIGFIYGTSEEAGHTLPAIGRQQTWNDLAVELADITGNIQISAFTLPPAVTIDTVPGSPFYQGNSVTFSSITRGAGGVYGFEGASYADPMTSDSHLYHAMLLTPDPVRAGQYIPMARVSLDSAGTYRKKPEGYELALFWQVSFF